MFPGLDPEHPLPPITAYVAFLADRRSMYLLLDLALAHRNFDLYFALNYAAAEAEQNQDVQTCAQLQEEAGRVLDLASGYAAEVRNLSWVQRN
jgi:hypothetical protein